MPASPDLPDSMFVEDVALVFEELAVITRPGAASRRPETSAVADVLRRFRKLEFLHEPAMLDGGDVLRIGRKVFVGQSERTNEDGFWQLRAVLQPFGYTVERVAVSGCLHLKSAVTQVAQNAVLLNSAWVDPRVFGTIAIHQVDAAEPMGANGLLVGETVVYPAAFPATRRRLEEAGIRTATVDVSEISKAEGAVTCCSLIFDADQ